MLAALSLVATTAAFTGCSDDKDDEFVFPSLEVSATELTFDEKGGAKTFDITTEGKWTISGAESDSWLAITPARQGAGNQQITVTVAASEEAHSAELTITCYGTYYGIDKEMGTKTVKITQTKGGEAPSTEEFYYNNFDKEEATETYGSGKSYPYLDQFDGWQNATGTGIAEVTYEYNGMSVRSNSTSNSNYSDYEGSGMNNLFFGNGGTFTIQKIAVTTTNLCLTFGAERYVYGAEDNTFVIGDLNVQLSADGTNWSDPIEYAFPAGANTNGRWNLATANFTLPDGTTTLYIRYTTKVASAHRVDDVRLTGGVGGQQITFNGGGSGETPSGEEKAITIPEIIAALTSTETVLDAQYDRVFEAVVVTDKAGGNVNNNNLQVMTPGATEAGNGITLFGSGVTNPNDASFTFAKGDRVKVTLKAGQARIVNYNGLYEVTGDKNAAWVTIEKVGTETITPIVVDAKDLAAYQAMVVTLNDMTAPTTAAVWCEAEKYGQHTFTTGGQNVTVFVQSNMPGLVNTQFIAGATGSITGYATVYKGNAQICPQTPSDVAAFMSAAPSMLVSPTTLSFSATGDSKTVSVTKINADDTYTIEATADNGFTASVSGTTVTVTVGANETENTVSGTLTVQLMKEGAAVDTKTVTLSQAAPIVGNAVAMTKTDIENASRVSNYANFTVTAADGSVWTGFGMGFGFSNAGNFMPLQLGWTTDTSKDASKSYVKVPTLTGNATKVTIVPNEKTIAERAFVVLPADYVYGGEDAETVIASALASVPTTGTTDPLVIDLTGKNLKDFIIRSVGGACYIDSITVEYE